MTPSLFQFLKTGVLRRSNNNTNTGEIDMNTRRLHDADIVSRLRLRASRMGRIPDNKPYNLLAEELEAAAHCIDYLQGHSKLLTEEVIKLSRGNK